MVDKDFLYRLLAVDATTPSKRDDGKYEIKERGFSFASGFTPEECKANARAAILGSQQIFAPNHESL